MWVGIVLEFRAIDIAPYLSLANYSSIYTGGMSEQYVERLKPCQILEDIRENLDFYEEGIH
ncbi:hypothetical protein V1477_021295 [Vespula maculifrons]|uniref:Uncharacterized protein n=1 Tax=Vespula maculifrons TaxID=7453 RepID=A0ABD2AGQ0_VESMC